MADTRMGQLVRMVARMFQSDDRLETYLALGLTVLGLVVIYSSLRHSTTPSGQNT